jgi:putative ABC transport system permease protein
MNLKSVFIASIRALSKNKMRSALTSIGIIIGVSSVIMMIGIGNSARIEVRERVHTYGANAMSVFRSKKNPLNERDLEYLRKTFSQIKYITPIVKKSARSVKFRNRFMYSKIVGVNNDFFRIKEWPLSYGRYFTELEILSREKVVVIGESVRLTLFGNVNPLDNVIIVNNVPCKVIGSLTEMGQAFSGKDLDNLLLLPYTTVEAKMSSRNYYDEIYIAVESEIIIEKTRAMLQDYFRRVHNIPPGGEDDFEIKTSKEQLKLAEYISKTLSILLAGIASISLFVGGVGIMNIMLVSVSERTREIGIRMAIGAKKRDILVQFLIESVTLSSVGGIVGITIGLLGYYFIIVFVRWPFIFSLLSILLSFLFSCAVGIFFGYYPAKKASDLKPIEALRYE